MSLDMLGTIDATFVSVPASRTSYTSGYDALGYAEDSAPVATSHTVNLQTTDHRKIESLVKGGERIVDARTLYVNDGDLYDIKDNDEWSFTGVDGTFRTVELDNRPWRNYCKIIVSRNDDE